MLHLEAVYPGTMDLLKKLMTVPEFSDFYLVGGTALALQYGHRISIDLDLFGNVNALDIPLIDDIIKDFGKLGVKGKSRVAYGVFIDEVKVDFVKYPFKLLEPLILIDGIRLASDADIGAMKLEAITGRGKRKDFVDLYFLLQKYSLEQLLNFYESKFPSGNPMLVLRSLVYFEDANEDMEGLELKKIKWEEIKQFIIIEHSKLLKK